MEILNQKNVALGTFMMSNCDAKSAVKQAIELGYRVIDAALIYFNERGVGEALQECFVAGLVRREDLFIISKLWGSFHRTRDPVESVRSGCMQSLSDLQLEYIDLYLIHSPVSLKPGTRLPTAQEVPECFDCVDLRETWREMLELKREGLVKHVGVSNFNQSQLEYLMMDNSVTSSCDQTAPAKSNLAKTPHVSTISSETTEEVREASTGWRDGGGDERADQHEQSHLEWEKPSVIQLELRIYFNNRELVQFCLRTGISVFAYSALGNPFWLKKRKSAMPSDINDDVAAQIAHKMGRSAAQIALKFALQSGASVVIAKSRDPEHLAENLRAADEQFQLSQEDFAELEKRDRNERICAPIRTRDHKDYPFK